MNKIILILSSIILLSCQKSITPDLVSNDYFQKHGKVKNVIFIIGDGMGPQQLSMLNLYSKYAPKSIYKGSKTNLEKIISIGETGLVMTNPNKKLVTDSSCSATQYATGEYSLPEVVGLNDKGEDSETILEMAKKAGLATGLVSDTRITHATPASYASHAISRNNENLIAKQMINTGADVMYSGGLRHFLPKSAKKDKSLLKLVPEHIGVKSKREDELNLLKVAQEKGYQLVFDKNSMQKSKNLKKLGLFTSSHMPDGIWNTNNKNKSGRKIPTLAEMTKDAIETLDSSDKGFFLMVEAGQVDWAGHRNDAGLLLHEMLRTDDMLGVVYNWVKNRKDTLVIVTADHETGGFGFSYSGYQVLKPVEVTGKRFKGKEYRSKFNYGEFEVLDKLYNQKRSHMDLVFDIASWPKTQQTTVNIKNHFEKFMDFEVTKDEVKEIMKSEKNKYYLESHPVLNSKNVPKVNDFSAYYTYGAVIRSNLIGREIAHKQSVVWATGSHTSTPVSLFAVGPKSLTDQFDGVLHSTEVGRLAMKALGLTKKFSH